MIEIMIEIEIKIESQINFRMIHQGSQPTQMIRESDNKTRRYYAA